MTPERETWFGPATDGTWGTNLGPTILHNVHPESQCAPRPCVLHRPSDHHMRSWPTLFRGDLGLMERTCPHGIGHPDPDDIAYHKGEGRDWVSVHSCDGCCRRPEPRNDGESSP